MLETAVVIDKQGRAIHWHVPPGRTVGSLPDSGDLWQVLWDARDTLSGVAHTHPGAGSPLPSREDVTTFAAVEAGLGVRLIWWIASSDHLAAFRHTGPDRYDYAAAAAPDHDPAWLPRLRALSGYDDTEVTS
jgi:hypothetical protein